MVFNATFNTISVTSWQSVLLVEETRVPRENHQPAASHWQTLSHNIVSDTAQIYFSSKTKVKYLIDWFDFLVFNATFSDISAISRQQVLVVEEAGVPGENHRPWASNW